MFRHRLSFIGMVVVCSLLIALTACGHTQPAGTSSAGPRTGDDPSVSPAQGVTDTAILVGHLGPQTGATAEYDKVRQGIQAYFDVVNEEGGVFGRKLTLIAHDDQYQPSETVKGARRLVEEEKVFAILYPIGTANVNAIKPYLEEKGIPVVGLGTGASMFVEPPIRNFFGYQFNYGIESRIYVDFAINQLGAKRFTFVFQNDDFGKQGLEAAKQAVAENPDAEVVAEIPFLATDQDFSSQAQRIVASNTDVVMMFTTPKPAASLRKELYKINATDMHFMVSSTGGSDPNQFNMAGEEAWEGVISSTALPFPEDSDDPDMKKYLDKFQHQPQLIGSLTQSGWAVAQIFVEALKRTGEELTWDKFIQALETFDNWDGSILPSVTYTSENRYGVTSLMMMKAENGRYVPISGFIRFDPETKEVIYSDGP